MQVIEILDNNYIVHRDVISKNIQAAEAIDIVVAFAKFSGLKLVGDLINEAIERCTKIRIIVGLDFYVSDPDLLRHLYRIAQKKEAIDVFVSSPDKGVFHSKLYAFYTAKSANFIIGSANFTGGGFSENWELSTHIKNASAEVTNRIKTYVSDLISEKVVAPLTPEIISEYEKRYLRALAYRGLAEKKIERGPATDKTAGIEFFEVRLETFRADGFEETMEERAIRRDRSLTILQAMSRSAYRSNSEFLSDFDQLISFYNSSALYRGRVAIGDQWRAVVALYRLVCSFPPEQREISISDAFEKIKNINKFGVNLLTEPLHSIDNSRFAIMNGNSVHGLNKAVGKNYERYLNKMLITGDIYLNFCSDMLEVMASLRLQNLSELDALFNYFYFNG